MHRFQDSLESFRRAYQDEMDIIHHHATHPLAGAALQVIRCGKNQRGEYMILRFEVIE